MIGVKDIIKNLRAGELSTGELHLAADALDAQRRHIQLLDKEFVKLKAENAKLRKVMNDVMNIALNGDAEEWLALREVLAEVDISKKETTMGEGRNERLAQHIKTMEQR